MSDIDPEHNQPSQDDYYLPPLRAAIDAARALQAHLDELGVGKPPAPMVALTPERMAALKVLVALGDSRAPLLAEPARDNIESAVEAIWAMLAEARGR